jgi:aspartate/tyrosine/aromatic aminotransferase
LDIQGLLKDLKTAPNGSIILLHACAHNPTGCDPTMEEWKLIADVLEDKQHVAFFDSAYQVRQISYRQDLSLAHLQNLTIKSQRPFSIHRNRVLPVVMPNKSTCEILCLKRFSLACSTSHIIHVSKSLLLLLSSAAALRYVTVERKLPVLLAQSFAKNFGLYGERCGTFSVVCANEQQKQRILSQLRIIIRPMYSSPPRHGSSIVKTVLSNDALTEQYYTECASMAKRIQEMRTRLVETLRDVAGSKHDWSHVTEQIGMFAYTGMSKEMCLQLTNDFAIYLTLDGRISLAGLNNDNLEYVAKAIHSVTNGKSITTAPPKE